MVTVAQPFNGRCTFVLNVWTHALMSGWDRGPITWLQDCTNEKSSHTIQTSQMSKAPLFCLFSDGPHFCPFKNGPVLSPCFVMFCSSPVALLGTCGLDLAFVIGCLFGVLSPLSSSQSPRKTWETVGESIRKTLKGKDLEYWSWIGADDYIRTMDTLIHTRNTQNVAHMCGAGKSTGYVELSLILKVLLSFLHNWRVLPAIKSTASDPSSEIQMHIQSKSHLCCKILLYNLSCWTIFPSMSVNTKHITNIQTMFQCL